MRERTNLLGWALWLGTLVLTVGLCGVMAWLSPIGRAPMTFMLVHLALVLCSVALVATYPFQRRATWALIAVAILCRLAIMPVQPSDDVYRYAWEGRVTAAGLNPYVHAPLSEDLAHLRDGDWHRINHPDKTAIYPPATIMLFSAVSQLSSSPWWFNALFSLADVLVVLLIVQLLRARHRHEKWSLLYAVNPVILLAFAGEAHLDVLMVASVMLGLLAFQRRHWRLMFAALAAAIHVKYVAVLLLPFLLRRDNIRYIWVFALALFAPFISFMPLSSVFATLHTFSTDFHFNSSVHYLLGQLFDSYTTASWASALLLMTGVLLVRLATPRPLSGAALSFALLLLFMPTVHFWYLSWLIPFLCFYPSFAGITFTAAVALTFASQGHAWVTGNWHEFHGLVLIEYLAVATALLVDLRRKVSETAQRPVKSISVILPTLNEAATLRPLFKNLERMHTKPLEIIVADGGSTDGTLRIAEEHNAVLVESKPGRGLQIDAAAEVARGDVLFICHADMALELGLFDQILRTLNHSSSKGGAAGCTFASSSLGMRVVDQLNALRASLFGISFGDQGQFMRRDVIPLLGGLPRLPLMEDVEISLRMKEQFRPAYLGGGIVASERRWATANKLSHALLVVSLVFRYMLMRALLGRNMDVRRYYQSYYGRRTASIKPVEPCKENIIQATKV